MDTLSNLKNILVNFYDEYNHTTPKKLKIVDAYLFYIMLTGIIQFVYCCVVGTFPFNSFLSGFISCVGSFVLGGKKTLQLRFSGFFNGILFIFGSRMKEVLAKRVRHVSEPNKK